MRSTLLASLLALCLAAPGACRPDPGGGDGDGDGDGDADSDADSDADGDSDGDGDTDFDWPEMGCTKVDILFVIDDSGSMSEEQSNLASNFPRFIQLIEDYRTPNGTQLDYRVGVTSSSRANFTLDMTVTQKQGGAQCTPGTVCANPANTCECVATGCSECTDACPGNCFCEPVGATVPFGETCNGEDGRLLTPTGYTEPWIQGPGGHVSAAFSSTALVGTSGCGSEMPLYAAEHALSLDHQAGPGMPNQGFLRDGSLLMVIVLTDEDDCSTELDVLESNMCMDILHPMASAAGETGCTAPDGSDVSEAYQPMSHYVRFFDDLMGGRNHWAAAVIAGERSCSTAFGDAGQAFRLQRFITEVGDNGVFHDICDADLVSALDAALDTLTVACDEYELY